MDETTMDDFLAHYGVMGMKWGVRKEEPTSGRRPGSQSNLTNQNGSSSPTGKTGTRVSALTKKDSVNKDSEEHKALRRVLIGAAVVGGVLVAGTAAYIGVDYLLENKQAMLRFAKNMSTDGSAFRKNLDLMGPKTVEELSELATKINPLYKVRGSGGKVNCRRSTFAYELNRRGYDVDATASFMAWGQDSIGRATAMNKRPNIANPLSAFNVIKGRARTDTPIGNFAKVKSLDTDGAIPNIIKALDSHPDGARGEFVMNISKKSFKDPKKNQSYGHSMAWEKIDGKIHIFDTQIGKHFTGDESGLAELIRGWGQPSSTQVVRLDDVDLDLKFLNRWAKNRES